MEQNQLRGIMCLSNLHYITSFRDSGQRIKQVLEVEILEKYYSFSCLCLGSADFTIQPRSICHKILLPPVNWAIDVGSPSVYILLLLVKE